MASRLKKRWVIQNPIPEEVDQALAARYEWPTFRKLLYNRGIHSLETADEYLEYRLAENAGDPYRILGMREAVERIAVAIDRGEKITVYGDYDVDGVTATALLTQALRAFGAAVDHHIPNRFSDGYGLNLDAVEMLHENGTQLIVSVDCGIRSPGEAARARELGLDMIISDHHQPGEQLPDACAVICPKRAGDEYPFKELSGVGLAYKIAQALTLRFPEKNVAVEGWLDLVAIGTVADMVPLLGENRMLVSRGVKQMRETHLRNRQGLLSLANVSGVKPEKLSAGNIAFMLAPRLNSSGRLQEAKMSLDLIMCDSMDDAGRLAQQLDDQNRKRQSLTRAMQEEAIESMRGKENEPIFFAFKESFNPGVVGLVAARLVDAFYRPAVVGHIEGDFVRASCRSIPEFHITNALDACKDLLVRHGGHALAAGFTARQENLPLLMDRLGEIARQQLSEQDLCPSLQADCEIPLDRLKNGSIKTFMDIVEKLEPTGQGNPEAVFVSRNLRVINARTVGGDKQHLRFTVLAGQSTFEGIVFRQGDRLKEMKGNVDLLYTVEWNDFNGRSSLQLNVRDFVPSDPANDGMLLHQ